jgi:hypothetical protein
MELEFLGLIAALAIAGVVILIVLVVGRRWGK